MKARHRIKYLYDENDNVHSVELYEIIDRKVNPDTNELFVRAEFEFEDGKDMDTFFTNHFILKNQHGFRIWQMKTLCNWIVFLNDMMVSWVHSSKEIIYQYV